MEQALIKNREFNHKERAYFIFHGKYWRWSTEIQDVDQLNNTMYPAEQIYTY